MSTVNIFRYRPQHMKTDRFHSIAEELHLDGRFADGEEGMVLHNDHQILTWSQPNAKFGGVLFYADRERSLAEPARELPEVDLIQKYMGGFLERSHLMPDRSEHEVSVKLEAKATEAMFSEERDEVKRLPMRVDVSSRIKLDNLPVMGPRAKVRAAFGKSEAPHFLHVGLWKTVEVLKKGELVSKDRLRETIDDRVTRREKKAELRVHDIFLAYWAHEYRGGADVLEPYYFVAVENLENGDHKGEEGSGPRQILRFPAYN